MHLEPRGLHLLHPAPGGADLSSRVEIVFYPLYNLEAEFLLLPQILLAGSFKGAAQTLEGRRCSSTRLCPAPERFSRSLLE